jgi:Tfp pilus assembly protein PilX
LRRRTHERGFALLIVLWALVLLTLVFTQLVSAGRGEAELTANLRAGATAEAAADAVFGLIRPARSTIDTETLAPGRRITCAAPSAAQRAGDGSCRWKIA